MLTSIKPTRSELLRVRKRIILAKKGHELLKKKQDSLVIEFFKLLKEVKEQEKVLHEEYIKAVNRMNQARALESDLTIKAAALSLQEHQPLAVHIKNLAGVHIPQLGPRTDIVEPRYGSLMLQDVGHSYIKVINLTLLLAAKETALRKILIEIKKTKRRAHALNHILIPELEHAKKMIMFQLEERSREEFTRLKRRKR